MINAFESAPEMRLGALQALLVLGLIGRFGRHPDSGELRRWGPALHDRFMLPDLLFDDLRTVVADLVAADYPFQLDWFKPLFELRFPVLGSVQIGPLTLKLRSAHEPWPLLAEEATAGGVARFVDAANERLQVTLSGAHPGRYLLVCNGHRVPLQETATHGEYIAGVRYKVSNPPATLHPTVWPVQALVFDVIDTWTGRRHRRLHLSTAPARALGPDAAFPHSRRRSGPANRARRRASSRSRSCRCERWARAAGSCRAAAASCPRRLRRRSTTSSSRICWT